MHANSAPDFRLYPSNALDTLAALLAQELRRPMPGQPLLQPEVVLIPQVAMRRWLQSTLAAEHGVAANLEFLTPGEFVARALERNLGAADDDLDMATTQWRLYATLQSDLGRDAALAPLADYLADGDALKPWALAGELGSVFENTRHGAATGCCAGKRAPTRTTRKPGCGAASPPAANTAHGASATIWIAMRAPMARCRKGCRRVCSPSPS